MVRFGEKEWQFRDLVGVASIVSGYALDGIGHLPTVNVMRYTGETDIDYRGRVMARLMEIGPQPAAD